MLRVCLRKPGTPLPENFLKVVLISQAVGINAPLRQKAKHCEDVLVVKALAVACLTKTLARNPPHTMSTLTNMATVVLRMSQRSRSYEGNWPHRRGGLRR